LNSFTSPPRSPSPRREGKGLLKEVLKVPPSRGRDLGRGKKRKKVLFLNKENCL